MWFKLYCFQIAKSKVHLLLKRNIIQRNTKDLIHYRLENVIIFQCCMYLVEYNNTFKLEEHLLVIYLDRWAHFSHRIPPSHLGRCWVSSGTPSPALRGHLRSCHGNSSYSRMLLSTLLHCQAVDKTALCRSSAAKALTPRCPQQHTTQIY